MNEAEIRAIIRQEIDRTLSRLTEAVIAPPEPEDEIVAILFSMPPEEFERIMHKVQERRAAEPPPHCIDCGSRYVVDGTRCRSCADGL